MSVNEYTGAIEAHNKNSYPLPDDPCRLMKSNQIPDDTLLPFLSCLGVTENVNHMSHINIDLDWNDDGLVRLKIDRFSPNPEGTS